VEQECKFRSDFRVQLVRNWGSDRAIVEDAQARDPDTFVEENRIKPILGKLIGGKIRHTSPLEHSGMCVYVECPAVVWWEWTRHRFLPQSRADHSFNLESGRYKILKGEFYLTPPERPIEEPDDFKPMRPAHVVNEELTNRTRTEHMILFQSAWRSYQRQIEMGVAREVARNVFGPAIYYSGRVSGGVMTWLHFLALRTKDNPQTPSSYPQWEIEQVANKCETIFADLFPVVHQVFNETGRFTMM